MSESSSSHSRPSDPIWDDPQLTAYVMGELTGDAKMDFETRIRDDGEVAAAVREMQELLGDVKQHFASEPVPEMSAQRQAAIISAGRSPAPGGSEPADSDSPPADSSVAPAGRPSRQVWWAFAVVAACLVIVVGGISLQLPNTELSLAVDDELAKPAAITQDEKDSDPMRFEEALVNGLGVDSSAPKPIAAKPPASRQPGSDESLLRQSGAQSPGADKTAGSKRSKAVLRESLSDRSNTIGNESIAVGSPVEMHMMAGPAPVSGGMMGGGDATMEGSMMMGGYGLPSPSSPSAESAPSAGVPVPAAQNWSELRPADQPVATAGRAMLGKSATVPSRVRRRGSDPSSDPRGQVAGGMSFSIDGLVDDHMMLGADQDRYDLKALESERRGLESKSRGRGPGRRGDQFDPIIENEFKRVADHPISTFSIDVDTASYSKVRSYIDSGVIPRPDSVRIEELVNYFRYDYQTPANDGEHPLVADFALSVCPWNPDHRLARVAVVGKTMQPEKRPPCNLVFLIDTSGSMSSSNKLPLVVEGLRMLTEKLDKNDRVAIVAYASASGLVLDSTPANRKKKILKALDRLRSGGSTNGGAGIRLAYDTARDHFIPEGVNRVILCSDGDFNVGTTSTDELVSLVEREAKSDLFLTVLGFGMGNHNDSMMERISGRGNGNYAFIDTRQEARKVLVNQISGTLVTIAKDVKLQLEFNPTQVGEYRLIGYENRMLAKEDFNDDKKDAGEIGAGHQVTALYELVPAGEETSAVERPAVDPLRYQSVGGLTDAAESGESLTLKLRYKPPTGDTSTKVEFPAKGTAKAFEESDESFRWAAAVAGFGMNLRQSQHAGDWDLEDVIETARGATGSDEEGLRAEFIEMVETVKRLRAGLQ